MIEWKAVEQFFIETSVFDIHMRIGDWIYNAYVTYSRPFLNALHDSLNDAFYILLGFTVFITVAYLMMSVMVKLRKAGREVKLDTSKAPTVTVQIPTYNELAAIRCAKKCLDFDYPKDRYKIIIGDDSSDRKISSQIDAFAKKHPGQVAVTRRGSNEGFKPGNLNHMLKFSEGEIIVIFDSDFEPPRDFLKRIVEPFTRDENISVVQSRWDIDNFSQNLISRIGGIIPMLCNHIALPFLTSRGCNGFLLGSAEAVRRKHLEEVGGWLNGSLTEDIECSLRFMMQGRRLVYLENLLCKCEAPFTLKDLLRQQMRWAYGVISAFKMHFKGIIKTPNIRTRDKWHMLIFIMGYLFALSLLALTGFGTLSFITAEPSLIDWARFLSETSRNILITSGFIITSIIALKYAKKLREIDMPAVIAASMTVGLIVTYYVCIGIFKALFNRPMEWFMLKKKANVLATTEV